MKNKKSNIFIIICIVILSFILGCLFSNNILKNNEIAKEEVLWEYDDLVQDLYKTVSFHNDFLKEWYFYENENVTLESISNNQKLFLAFHRMPENLVKQDTRTSETGDYIEDIMFFDIESFDEAMKKVFGEKINYEKEDFMPTACDEYIYNEDTQKYIAVTSGCGGPGNSYIINKLYKAVKINDKIILYEKFAFINVDEIIYGNTSVENEIDTKAGIYKDVKSTEVIKFGNFYDSEPNDIFEDYIDEMSMVKYTFKKDSNNEYHFYSSEIIDKF